MPRETIDAKTLVNWLNEELRKQIGCTDCSISDVYKLPTRAILDGCNWSVGVVTCGGSTAAACEAGLSTVYTAGRARYNLP